MSYHKTLGWLWNDPRYRPGADDGDDDDEPRIPRHGNPDDDDDVVAVPIPQQPGLPIRQVTTGPFVSTTRHTGAPIRPSYQTNGEALPVPGVPSTSLVAASKNVVAANVKTATGFVDSRLSPESLNRELMAARTRAAVSAMPPLPAVVTGISFPSAPDETVLDAFSRAGTMNEKIGWLAVGLAVFAASMFFGSPPARGKK